MSGLVVLLNTNYLTLFILLLTVSKAEFRGQFPYLDKLQVIGYIPWVKSKSDYQKFNIQCLVFNKMVYEIE